MPTCENLTAESRFMALFVGAKHSGKTCAAVSFMTKESKKRVKVLDGDGRIRGILGAPWIDKSRIDYDFYAPRVAGQNKTFFDRVNADLEALLIEIQSGKCIYETYVSDSATSFCRNLILDAIPLTHIGEKGQDKGRKIGTMNMAGPSDYGFESTGMDAYLSFLRSIPINVIMTAHLVDRFGKVNPDDPYSETIVVGEKLSLRDKIAANTSIYFDHIFKFSRRMQGGKEHFFVEFIGDFACTSFPNLTPGVFDITGVDFHEFLMDKVKNTLAAKA